MKAVVHPLVLEPGRRVLAVSDVHGHLAWLQALLQKANFSGDDILVLVGDLLERGPHSLETLRYVMDLKDRHSVYCVCGNCDSIALNLHPHGGDHRAHFLKYLSAHPESILFQMMDEGGFTLRDGGDLEDLGHSLDACFPRELAFLRGLPTVLESRDYVFVHGGVPSYQGMEELDAWSCMKNDNFLEQGLAFPKYCVVGHCPTSLYREDIPNCDPIVERTRKIVSIDGGCGVKRDGQLNAVVLPREDGEDFSWVRYDDYPVKRARDPQAPSRHPVTIRWMDNAVEPLEQSEDLTLCRHISTGKTLWVPSGYLSHHRGIDTCEDCTDYRLPVAVGDALSVLEVTSRGALVKKDGVVGWYLGQMTD